MGSWGEWKPAILMSLVVVAFAAMNTMIKKVIDEGMNKLVLITFRQLIATLVLTPIAYFSERYDVFMCLVFFLSLVMHINC